MADTALGDDVSGGVLRRAAGQDPRGRSGTQQGGVPGAGGAARWHTRHPGPVDRADRRRQVLDEGVQRTEDPRHAGHPDRRHGWLEGDGTVAERRVPGHDAADLHRAPDPLEPGLRQLEGTSDGGSGLEADLHGSDCGGCVGCASGVRARPVGSTLRANRRSMAPGLGSGDPVLYVPASDPQGDLYHQRHREHQRAVAPGSENARALPQR
ncbi:hypothetical protein LMG26219_06340 [Achromobacter marplatensis]|nr:hypothetical protein LMG26219_06340 [Achromobacter marplatensis]